MKKIGFIGYGNMASALATGFVEAKKVERENLYAYAPNQEKLEKNTSALGINKVSSLKALVEAVDTVFVACKPYQIEDVLAELGKTVSGKQLVSVAAGWDYIRFRNILPEDTKIQCIMPNTPAQVRAGVLLVAKENDWEDDEREELLDLLSGVGKVVELETRLMDAGMAISGCGPAFMDMVIEALGDAGVKHGLKRKDAYELASQTMLGAAKLQLETGLHPGELKDNVCSPGGTTIKGVEALEEEGLRNAFIKAINAVLK